jgi:hypothetical protein
MPNRILPSVVIVAFSLAIFIVSAVAFFTIGAIWAEQSCYKRYFNDRRPAVDELITQMELTNSLVIDRDSRGRVVLIGNLESSEVRAQLTRRLATVLGMRDATHAVLSLVIDKSEIDESNNRKVD